MGASAWSYYVPYQQDLGQALEALRQRVFAAGRYVWPWGEEWVPAKKRRPRPASMELLFADEAVQTEGTHSILDMSRVLSPGEEPVEGTIEPVSAEEALRCAGTDRPTKAHIAALDELIRGRWLGRCVVLHDERGEPNEIYFWGYSGD